MAAATKKEMTDEEFSGEIRNLLSGAANFNYGSLAAQRTKAMDYYLGRPFGNEVRGRSQVVSMDVSDTVEGIMPYLMKIFTASDRIVEVDPTREDTVDIASQATDYLNWVFYKKNRGFFVLYQFFKDALLQKNGVIKWFRERVSTVKRDEYKGLTVHELAYLIQIDGNEIESYRKYPDIHTGEELYDVVIVETREKGDIRVVAVPPEEFVVNRRHNSVFLKDAQLCCHRSRQTKSQLLEMGFDEDLIDECSSDEDYTADMEEQARDTDDGGQMGDELDFGTTEGVYKLDEIYVKMDRDGDGIDEQYIVFMIGDTLLDYELTDQVPFASTTPIIQSHRFYGRSIADLVMDIQEIKSTIQRQSLDNLYLTNNPRLRVLRNQVHLPDLMEVRPGGIIRMDSIDAVQPLDINFVARESFTVLGYFDEVKENRTGLTKYTQGMDSNSLNKTATGVSRIMDASKERIELIARIFAETGVAEMFVGLLKLASGPEARKEIIRLRGAFVEMDPSEFKELCDVTVNVGLGTGDKQEQMAFLDRIMAWQQNAAPLGYVKPIHMYNSISDMINLSGRKDVGRFFDKPDPEATMPQPPNPEQMKIDGEVQKHKITTEAQTKENMEKFRLDAETTKFRIKTQAETELAAARIRANEELRGSCLREAIKIAAAQIGKGVQLSVDELATQIALAADKLMPTSLKDPAGGQT